MRVLVCGATGCVGSAVANALRARGHQVVAGARAHADGPHTMQSTYMAPVEPRRVWARLARRSASRRS